MPDAGQSVGTPLERLDGASKVDGTESYGADHVPDDALLVRAVCAPAAPMHFTFGDLEDWQAAQPVRRMFSPLKIFPVSIASE